jgi:putative nucleotidyltransferase with HDIG domain
MSDISSDRAAAWNLLAQYTQNESLLKHALAVEGAMRFYAKHFNENEEAWGVVGLLHDFDYERFPDPNAGGHPYAGAQILRDKGYPEELVEAILSHAQFTGVARKTTMAKALFAVDELTGLITASVYVRPDRSIHTLETSSVKKKMKDKAFARAVNREEIVQGAADLGVELDAHIANVILSMRERAQDLGLEGRT